MFLLILLPLFLLFPPSFSGTFYQPTSVDAIVQSISNKNEYSDYTFNVIPSTQIPIGGTLEITFPSQFSLGLGINIDPNAASYCNTPCDITNYVVTFQMTAISLPGVVSSFTIYSVLNPPNKGGTGNFIVRSKKGQNLLDENLVFGTIGIADSVTNLTSATMALDSSGSSAAGVLTKYSFSFKTNQVIPWNSYFMITVPKTAGFLISKNPSCASFSINSNIISGTLSCSSEGYNIIVTGLAADIPKAFEVGITVSLTNPTVSGSTDSFRVAILRTNTHAVYAWNTAITGVTITPGVISKTTFSLINPALIQSRGKWMNYRLKFIPKNPLPLGSQISIQFPAIGLTNCYIEYGIQDVNPDIVNAPCGIQGTDSLLISGFQEILSPGEISLTVRIKNPVDSGTTSTVKIITYKDAIGTVIDQDVTSAATVIKNIQSTSISPGMVTLGGTATGTMADSTPADFYFQINPSITVPAEGFIRVVFPNEFTIGTITAADCQLGTTSSASCVKTDQVILMKVPIGVAFNIATLSSFSIINNKVTKPIYAGDFLFDLTTFAIDGVSVLDSYSMKLIITPNSLSSASYTLIGKQAGKIGTLRVDFVSILQVPSGKSQSQSTDIKGVIQLVFNSWALDLGTGLPDGSQIPCTASNGLLPLKGFSLLCTLYKKSSATIEIKNFQAIDPGSICRIYFPNLLVSSSQVSLNLIKRYNRVDLVLNNYLATPSTGTGPAITIFDFPKVFTFTKTHVSEIFDLSFDMDQSQPIAAGDSLLLKLPTYDVGYLQNPNMVTCFVGQTGTTPTAYECIKFEIIDWVLIFITNAYPSTPAVTIYLKNLKWPRYSYATGVPVYVVHYNNQLELEYKRYQKFEDFSVPVFKGFLYAGMSIPKKGKGYPDCAYLFKFKATNSIPNGGTVVLTFPTDYSLQQSFPSPIFEAPQFKGYQGSLSFSPQANKLTITNIAEFPEKSLFTIKVKGIKNPSPLLTTSTGWTIETNYNGNIINKQTNFDFFQYGNDYSPGTIIFNSITAFPQNALVKAEYTIEFTPNTPIPALGIISIAFPSAQFTSLPADPVCKISGGLTTFSSCGLQGSNLVIVTDTEYTTGSLIVKLKDVTNPKAGVTDGFVITTIYDGSFLDTTDDTDTSYRTILILPQAQPIALKSLDFEPRNEGEKSTYTFTVIPSSPIDRSMEIMIQFPNNYDDLIGFEVSCSGTSGIIVDYTISIKEKKIFLTGVENYSPSNDNPLTIVVYNVINPNRISSMDNFRIATYYSNTETFVDYNEDIPGLEMVSAPGWLTIFNISGAHYYARQPTNYTFSFTISKPLPMSQSLGAIVVAFPSSYDIPDKNVSCYSTPATFGNISCSVKQNKLYATGNPTAFTGNLVVLFTSIDNPPLNISVGGVTTVTYDGFNKYIIERSYPNLDSFSFAFTYFGPLITVNDDLDIIVERGTQTKTLYLTIDYPCALNLNFSTKITEFSLFPSTIIMSMGDLKSGFRVSVPVSLSEGVYYITWVTKGDNEQFPLYTPLKKTKVTVTNFKNVPIYISDISSIPYGGSSLTIKASTIYSPNIGIELVATLDQDYPGITLTKKNIIFSAGDNEQTFEIHYSNDSSVTNGTITARGGLTILLSGVNKNTFSLSTTHLEFLSMAASLDPPALTELVTSEIGQTYCTMIIGSNEIVMAYYMIALTGTKAPTFLEVYNQGPITYASTQKQYGSAFIDSSNRVVFRIDKLDAQTPYTIYVFLKNRGGNLNKIKTYDFVTKDRYPAAEFSIRFTQAYLNKAEINSTINSIAFALSMPPKNIYEKNYTISRRILNEEDCVNNDSNSKRELASVESVSTILTLNIFSITNSSNYPSPINMALLLNQKTAELTAFLTNYDSTYTIPSSTFSPYVPSFVETPTVSEIGQYDIKIKAKLDNYGYVFAIAINATEDKSKPTSFQIYHGYNSENVPCAFGKIEISESFTYFTFQLPNLVPNTQYNVYITAGSVHPGYPDLMSDKSVVLVAIQTKPLIIFDPLNINNARKIVVEVIWGIGLSLLMVILLV